MTINFYLRFKVSQFINIYLNFVETMTFLWVKRKLDLICERVCIMITASILSGLLEHVEALMKEKPIIVYLVEN
jgi:hypothetical protein